MAQMNDGPTDEELNAAMAVLTEFAAKHLPEGYVVRLEASAYDSGLSVLRDDDEEQTVLQADLVGWGGAVDTAIADAEQQCRLMRGFIG